MSAGQNNNTIWDQLTRVVIVLLLLAALLAAVVWTLPLMRQNEQYRKEIMRLDGKVREEEATQKRLKSSLDSQRDPKTVERQARERLGYARTGETVVRFEVPITNAQPVRK